MSTKGQTQLTVEAENARTLADEKLADSVKLAGASVKWISISYGASSNNFKRFIPGAPADSQVVKESFASPELTLRASWYDAWPTKGFLISFASTFKRTDNFGALSQNKVDVKETRVYEEGGRKREVQTSVVAYAGEYKEGLGAVSLAADFYWLSLLEHLWGIHLAPSVDAADNSLPSWTAEVGILRSFTGRKDGADGKVNLELFWRLNDLKNAGGAKNPAVLTRTSGGLRLNFPVGFR